MHDDKKPLVIEELPVPDIAAGQVLIRVDAAGMCRTDLPFVARECTYYGSFWGNCNDLREIVALAQQGKIRHAVKRIRLDEINENLELLRSGDVVGRAVVVY